MNFQVKTPTETEKESCSNHGDGAFVCFRLIHFKRPAGLTVNLFFLSIVSSVCFGTRLGLFVDLWISVSTFMRANFRVGCKSRCQSVDFVSSWALKCRSLQPCAAGERRTIQGTCPHPCYRITRFQAVDSISVARYVIKRRWVTSVLLRLSFAQQLSGTLNDP
jgi:hypothetical protein